MLCRSQAATAVCVPGEARSMIVPRRADRTIVAEDARDVRHVRLGGDGDRPRRFSVLSRGAAPQPPPTSCKPSRRRGRAPVAVTLPMVTKSPVREAAKRTPATVTATAAAAPQEDTVLQVRKLPTDSSSSF
jgi:hypothetical protein